MMDGIPVDFDNLYGTLSPEAKDLLAQALDESFKGFMVALQDVKSVQKSPTEPFNTKVAEFACCPPPKMVSLAAFDDLVIKILGDCGGRDEELWRFAEKLPNRQALNHPQLTSENAASQSSITNSASQQFEQSQEMFISNPNMSPNDHNNSAPSSSLRGQDISGRDSAMSIEENSAAEINSTDPSAPDQVSDETFAALMYRYWNGVAEVVRSRTQKTADKGAQSSNDQNMQKEHGVGAAEQNKVRVPESPDAAMEIATGFLDTYKPVLEQANQEMNVSLGKRGRYFLDIWEEEDFLLRNKPKAKLRSLRSWDDLFHAGYSDNHDGCYRDWLLAQQQETKSRLMGAKGGRKKRQCDPIFWSAVVAAFDNTGLKRIVPPPVPVAIHHPAGWGIRPATTPAGAHGDNRGKGDWTVIHPASVRSAQPWRPQHQYQVPPPITTATTTANSMAASCSSSSSGAGNATDSLHDNGQLEGRRLLRSLGTPAQEPTPQQAQPKEEEIVFYTDFKAARRKQAAQAAASKAGDELPYNVGDHETGIEDVDDFNLYAAKLTQQLQAEEARNFIRLARLQHVLNLNAAAEELRIKREKYERLVHRAAQRMEPISSDRVVYAYKPTRTQAATQALSRGRGGQGLPKEEGVLRLDVQGNVLPRQGSETAPSSTSQSRYNTRCINSDTIVAALRPNDVSANMRRDLLGASALRQVLHGGLLTHCLQVDAEIEVRIDKRWQVATITRIVYDGELARHIKVIPEDCTPFESVWIAVEDGRIAPCGTHLRPIKPTAVTVSAAASAKSPTTSLSPRPSAEDLRASHGQGGPSDQPANFAHVAEAAAGTRTESASAPHTVTPDESSPQISTAFANAVVAAASNSEVPPSQVRASSQSQSGAAKLTGNCATERAAQLQDPRLRKDANRSNTPTVAQSTVPVLGDPIQAATTSMQRAASGQMPTAASSGISSVTVGVSGAINVSASKPGPASTQAYANTPAAVAAATAAKIAQLEELSLRERTVLSNGSFPPTVLPPKPAVRIPAPVRTKLPLPLGANSERQLIPAVNPYTPLTYPPATMPQLVHPNGQPMFYNTLSGSYGGTMNYPTGSAPMMMSFVPYEYEPETDPASQYMYNPHPYGGTPALQLPSVSVPATLVPAATRVTTAAAPLASTQNGDVGSVGSASAGAQAGRRPPVSLIPPQAYATNSGSSETSSLSGAPSVGSTFRLGPRGTISRN